MAEQSLSELIEKFSSDLTATQGRDHQTASNYRHYLERFAAVVGVQSPGRINRETVEKFRAWLYAHEGKRRLHTATVNYHLTALRTFLKFLQRQGIQALSPSDVTLQPTPIRTVSTVETPGLNRLLNFPLKMEGRSVLQHRDRAILEVLGSTGLRVGEIARLQRDHVVAQRNELAVPGRNGKLRIVPLGNQTRYWITQYLKLRTDRAPQLFVRHDPAAGATANRQPKALTPRSIQRLIKKYAAAAGLGSSVQPRTLRHTVAANMLAAGDDLETVRERLGHAAIATTKVYLPLRRPGQKQKKD